MAGCAKLRLPGWLSAFMAQHFTFCWAFRILQQLFKVGSINIPVFQMKKKSRPRKSKGFLQCLVTTIQAGIKSSGLQTFLSQSPIRKIF